MESFFTQYLSTLQIGDLSTHKNMSIAPLFTSASHGPDYVTLQEAMQEGWVQITELGRSGSVPDIQVTNSGPSSVLLLDGEELVGAKQNRVLNTTILLKPSSETIIPVSCTEQGRWAFADLNLPAFVHSDTVMPLRVRAQKARSVAESLSAGRGHRADQQEVWQDVPDFLIRAEVSSPTRAMHDAYVTKAEELEPYTQAFPCEPRQRGCLVFVNGKVAGLDLLSRETAYQALHPSLLKSYSMEALIDQRKDFEMPSAAKARDFLKALEACRQSKHASVGLGQDHRFSGDGLVGSALVCDESVVHLAFFCLDDGGGPGRLSSFRQRRGFRRRR